MATLLVFLGSSTSLLLLNVLIVLSALLMCKKKKKIKIKSSKKAQKEADAAIPTTAGTAGDIKKDEEPAHKVKEKKEKSPEKEDSEKSAIQKRSEKLLGDKKEEKGDSSKTAKESIWSKHTARSSEVQMVKKHEGISVEPPELRFSKDGGIIRISLTNKTGTRVAVKVKCSDNEIFRVNPVFAFIPEGGTIFVEVWRMAGNPKPDRFGVVSIEAPEDAKNAQALFKQTPPEKQTSVVNVPALVFA